MIIVCVHCSLRGNSFYCKSTILKELKIYKDLYPKKKCRLCDDLICEQMVDMEEECFYCWHHFLLSQKKRTLKSEIMG